MDKSGKTISQLMTAQRAFNNRCYLNKLYIKENFNDCDIVFCLITDYSRVNSDYLVGTFINCRNDESKKDKLKIISIQKKGFPFLQKDSDQYKRIIDHWKEYPLSAFINMFSIADFLF